jgi:2-methylcitrate dehydratase PrpD
VLSVKAEQVATKAAHDRPRMQDRDILRQRAKVNLIHDDELPKLLPVRVGVVEIELSDGTRLAERVSAVRYAAQPNVAQ